MIAITVAHGRRDRLSGSHCPRTPCQDTARERSTPPPAKSEPASMTRNNRIEGCTSSRKNVKIGQNYV